MGGSRPDAGMEGTLQSQGTGGNGTLDASPGRMGEDVRFQERLVVLGQERPHRRPKWKVYGNCHKTAHVFGDYRTSKKIVLVEDLISAHKVGRVNPVIPLFGTKVFGGIISTLKYINLPVLLWLDKDQEGNVQKTAMKLSMYINQPVDYVFTDNDPKECSIDLITKVVTQ